MELTREQSGHLNLFVQRWFRDSTIELESSFGEKGVVESTVFLQIAQRLHSKGFERKPQDDYLNIIAKDNIRFSIQGLNVVQSYCRDDKLEDKAFTVMIKNRMAEDSNLSIAEYDLRVKLRSEVVVSEEDPRVNDLIQTWDKQPKAFRLIRRWSFMGKGIRVDLSMVRQSPTNERGEFQYTRKFLDKNILQEVPRYEVEVELLHDTPDTHTAEESVKSLIRGVGEVLRAIQRNTLLLRSSVRNMVRSEYQAMMKIAGFRGVNPVTLERKNMTDETEGSNLNITSGYNVTDKADGLRAMGFVNARGELFLLDQSMNVYRTGLKNPKCANSLVDGEWITLTKENRPISDYLIFDIYHYENKKVSDLPFMTMGEVGWDKDGENRYHMMQEWYAKWVDGTELLIKGWSEKNLLRVGLKTFKFGTKGDDSIFRRGCAAILDTPHIYHTDGLILTSNEELLPDKMGVRFDYQFKWKPAKDNTVDFLIMYERDDVFPTDKVTRTVDAFDSPISYKTMRLYVGSAKTYRHPREMVLMEQPIVKDSDVPSQYRPVLFHPLNFSDTMANICNVPIQINMDTNEEYAMTEDSKEPISNESIVEMRYDPSRESGWRWIPARIRHDKTERYLRAKAKGGEIKYSGMMNSEDVANSVWNSIHQPITESMIRTGNTEPDAAEIEHILKALDTDISKVYYERKAPEENVALVSGLQDFHNKYIKNEILLQRSLKGEGKTLLDVACGKGGDMYKWIFNHAGYVVGIDTAGQNIMNPKDGAYKRYVQAQIDLKRHKDMPKIAFIIGDSSKSIVDGTAGATPQESDMLRRIFGRVNPVDQVPPYIEHNFAGRYRNGADVVACMFALHYFFKDMPTLDGFLNNLNDTVKTGGLFIGCCFDGHRIFNLLHGVESGHSQLGMEGNVQLWKITKEYDHAVLADDDTSVGLGINVDFISIGTEQREYLVSYPYLRARLAQMGFRELNAAELQELDLKHSTNTFDVSYDMFQASQQKSQKKKHSYPMTEIVKRFSFLNRWFIFKRAGVAPVLEASADSAVAPVLEASADSEVAPVLEASADSVVAPVSKKPSLKKRMNDEEKKSEPVEEQAEQEEKSISLPDRNRKFKETDLFRIGADVPLLDKLKIGDAAGGRWLALSAPFPIPDPEDESIQYPSIEHFLAAMKLKTSTKPNLAKDLMSSMGTVHRDFTAIRTREKPKDDSPRDFELLREESAEIRKKMTKTYLNQYRLVYPADAEMRWSREKDDHLRHALLYRWEHDPRFITVVKAAFDTGKYILFSTKVAGVTSELGGTLSLASGKIEGENKVGRMIMEIAEFRL